MIYSGRSALHDPGPLQYWLLTFPVHLDPSHGTLWGAALWCMVAGSLAIEATWSVVGAGGGLLASGIVLGTVAWMPAIALDPYWNPWFGMMFFLATLAAGWAVMSGRRRWWPVLVITGSVAAQAHLMFALASVALVILALVVGLADSFTAEAGYRWAVIGIVAGVACWIAPFIQDFTGQGGNLTALADSLGATGHQTGLALGLKAITASVQPPPFWWTSPGSVQRLSLINRRSAGFAVATLVLTTAVLVAAVRPLRSGRLAALTTISLLVSVAAVVTYAGLPATSIRLGTVGYLAILMLGVGVLSWLVAGSVVVLICRQVSNRSRASGAAGRWQVMSAVRRWHASGPVSAARETAARWAIPVAGIAAVAVIALTSSLAVTRLAAALRGGTNARLATAVNVASRQVGRALPGQPVALSVADPDAQDRRRLTLGLAWALRADGYLPEVSLDYARELGPAYTFRGQSMPHVTVLVRGSGVAVTVTGPPRDRHGAAIKPCRGRPGDWTAHPARRRICARSPAGLSSLG